MRKAVYDWLLRLPVRLAAGGIALSGVAATLWPNEVRAVIGGDAPLGLLAWIAVMLVVAYLLALLLLKPGPGETAPPSQVTHGPHSPSFGTVHGPVTINNGSPIEEQPKKSSYNWSQESLDGLARVMSGQPRGYARLAAMRSCPEMPIADALAYLMRLGRSREQARLSLQQALADSRLEVWGRAEVVPAHLQAPFSAKEIWERVLPGYWREFRLSNAAFDAEEDQPQTEAQSHVRKRLLRRYWSLRVSADQIKEEWPEPPKPPPDLGPNGWMAA